MKSQSISTRLLKVLLMGFVLAALLMSFKVSASAREKIYPSSYSTTVLSKGFTYKLSYSPSYYRFRSSNPSVIKVSKQGVLTAKKKGSCHIHIYSKYTGKWITGFPMKVRKNKYYGPAYNKIHVSDYSSGTRLILSSAYTKGKYAVLNLVLVNNYPWKVIRINSAYFNFYLGGSKIISKSIGSRKISVGRYSKKRFTVKLKLSKAKRKKLDWNRISYYTGGSVRYRIY